MIIENFEVNASEYPENLEEILHGYLCNLMNQQQITVWKLSKKLNLQLQNEPFIRLLHCSTEELKSI